MKKHIVITTSACGLDYYDQPHGIRTIYGHTLIKDGVNQFVSLTDVEDFCAIQLREQYHHNPERNISFISPSVDEIHTELLQLLAADYECLFIVIAGQSGCHGNFTRAIAKLTQEEQARINLYPSITKGFCAGLLALRAEQLLEKGSEPAQIMSELEHIERNSMMLYCIMDPANAPRNMFTAPLLEQDKNNTAPFPLAKATGDGEIEKIADLDSKEALLDRIVYEIRTYIGDNPYSGYTITPSNHSISHWFCTSLAEKLGQDHIATMPVTPVMAQIAGLDLLAVRIYHSPDALWAKPAVADAAIHENIQSA